MKASQQHTFAMYLISLCCFVIMGLIAVDMYVMTHEPVPPFIRFNPQKNVVYTPDMQGLNRPVLNRDSLRHWAAAATTAAYNYDFANYKKQIQVVISKYFTPAGGEAFVNDLQAKGVLKGIVRNQVIVSSVVQGTVVILDQGVINGKYSWKVQLPISVTYQSASEVEADQMIVTLLIVSVPTTLYDKGIGIDSFSTQIV